MFTAILDFEKSGHRAVFENMTAREFGEFLVEWSKEWLLLYDTSIEEMCVGVKIFFTVRRR